VTITLQKPGKQSQTCTGTQGMTPRDFCKAAGWDVTNASFSLTRVGETAGATVQGDHPLEEGSYILFIGTQVKGGC
jgi:hypothetical protein